METDFQFQPQREVIPEGAPVSDDDDSVGDPGERVDPNKFDNLCDGVTGSLALVHETLKELMEFKDELLLHSLPPRVLLRLGLVSGKVFRSVSDLHQPLNELIRLVRIYATPWEEKSAALQKLHDTYDKKQRQLNIAIHRLVMVEENRKHMEKTKRILNWEKLFSSVMTQKGHGRRWKFRMKEFQAVAKQGFDAVQAYVEALDSDGTVFEEPVYEEEMKEEEPEPEPEPEEEERPSSTPDLDATNVTLVPVEKPDMRDRSVWTHEPEFDRSLHARVFRPTGLNKEWLDLKCKLTYGQISYKTNSLDPVEIHKTEEDDKPAKGLMGLRGRGRGGKAGQQRKVERKTESKDVFEDCEFQVADEIAGGSHHTTLKQEILRVSVHHGPREQMVAMATIELQDLEAIDLPCLMADPPKGDEFDPEEMLAPPPDDDALTLTDLDASMVDGETEESKTEKPSSPHSKFSKEDEEKIQEADPLNFPLYSVFGTKAETQTPCGQLPLAFAWVKRLRPMTFNRFAGTSTFNEIVYDVTGIDLKTFVKGEVPEPVVLEDRACSVMEQEETVLKKDFDEATEKHEQEIEKMKAEHDDEMQVMAEQLAALQEQLKVASDSLRESPPKSAKSVQMNNSMYAPTPVMKQNQATSPMPEMKSRSMSQHSVETPHDLIPSRVSVVSRGGSSPQLAPIDEPDQYSEVLPQQRKTSAQGRPRPPPNFQLTHPSRTDIPRHYGESDKNFQERMRIYQENRARHLEELESQRYNEVSQEIERRLACEFKLSKDDDELFSALRDVNLPALFMPTSSTSGIYNPRAHQYFKPMGSTAVRISQPPSMVTLPPIPKHKVSVLNMFDMSQNFTRGPDYLLQKFISQQEENQERREGPVATVEVDVRQSTAET